MSKILIATVAATLLIGVSAAMASNDPVSLRVEWPASEGAPNLQMLTDSKNPLPRVESDPENALVRLYNWQVNWSTSVVLTSGTGKTNEICNGADETLELDTETSGGDKQSIELDNDECFTCNSPCNIRFKIDDLL